MSTLTDAQRLDVRRWMGYPSLTDDELDYVRWTSRYSSMTLNERLDGLTSAEETTLVDKYLTQLATLETDLYSARTNLDTDTAGPWIANKREVAQRTALFNKWRRDMCGFLGFQPGPSLGDWSMALVRG